MPKDYDSYKERAAKRAVERTSGKAFKLKEGPNEFRILLTPKGKTSQDAYFEFGVHENVGPEKAYLRCGIDPITGKGKCIICQKVIPRLHKRGKATRAAELEPKIKLVVTVSAVVKGKAKGKPQLWYPSKKTGDSVVGTIITSRKRDYLSHTKGYNLSIDRTGTTMTDTRYGPIEVDEEPSKVSSDIIDKLRPFDQNPDIPIYDEKKMKKAIGYTSAEDDDEDEDDDKPKSKKSKSKSRDDDDEDDDDDDDDGDDEDDDDEDDDDEDDDDEDEKPKKKSSKSKKKSKSEDDDEDEDDEDEDDDSEDDDEDDEDDEEDEDDEDDDSDEDEDDEEEDEKPRKSKSKSVKKKKK